MNTTKSFILPFIFIALLAVFSGCSSDDDRPAPQSRNIKYEITGNYSGRLTVAYADEGGNSQIINVSSLPWSKSLTIEKEVSAIAIAANNSGVSGPGEIGETITLKIYRNDVVVEESTTTALENGFIELGISYSFDL